MRNKIETKNTLNPNKASQFLVLSSNHSQIHDCNPPYGDGHSDHDLLLIERRLIRDIFTLSGF